MTRIIADISLSLDGFVTCPEPGPGNGLGTGGEARHAWALVGPALATVLVGRLSLHLATVVLGGGTPLFLSGPPRTLLQRSVVATSTATHLTYDVVDR